MSELRLRLEVRPCRVKEATDAVRRWHYSRIIPVGRLICHGVWESGAWVGVIIYGRGAARELGRPFGCSNIQVCELVRIALAPGRKVPTSRALGVSLRMLARTNPGLRCVVSYADTAQKHVGTLYQATNWIYTGETAKSYQFMYQGVWKHLRVVSGPQLDGSPAVVGWNLLPRRRTPPKHRYVYPLDERLRRVIAAQPYPKHAPHLTP
jgi:hypothetical protein